MFLTKETQEKIYVTFLALKMYKNSALTKRYIYIKYPILNRKCNMFLSWQLSSSQNKTKCYKMKKSTRCKHFFKQTYYILHLLITFRKFQLGNNNKFIFNCNKKFIFNYNPREFCTHARTHTFKACLLCLKINKSNFLFKDFKTRIKQKDM